MRIDTFRVSLSNKSTPAQPPHQTTTPAVQSAIEDTLDLSSQSRNLPATFQALDEDDKSIYLQNLARLLKAGIVGTEYLQVRGQTYRSFASTRFADPEIIHAKIQP